MPTPTTQNPSATIIQLWQPTTTTRPQQQKAPMLFVYAAMLLLLVHCVPPISCDYENTWNFYYEQPCCSNEVTNYAKHKR
ncbi:semaphorin-2A-like, partial [Rhagoletis pomonella]|uniref:semaphorin-2A-like n=1 Tax=Rhagoletis pomonella TaxID=28610 RepID=UPI0017825720